MEFQSILFADTPMELDRSIPAFFQDLHLDYILDIIKHKLKKSLIVSRIFILPFIHPISYTVSES